MSEERHTCYAKGCERIIPSRMLMCREHWHEVPFALKNAVWDAYEPGQERGKRPSKAWVEAAMAAKRSVSG